MGSRLQLSAIAMRDTHTSLLVLAPRSRPAASTLTHGRQAPPATPTMVAIADYSVGSLQRARRRLRRELLVRFHGGECGINDVG